ncbi:MAG: methyltransferase domain-containing protein [Amphiplicatus sp.]
MSGAVTPGGDSAQHTPPLGHHALTPLYDFAIASLTREKTWRKALVAAISPQPDDRILDIGSGTGSLALIIHQRCPKARYVGIDPDEDAVKRAINKTAKLNGDIQFRFGYFSAEEDYFADPPTIIVSSLVLHQVPLAEKQRILSEAKRALSPDGALLIADYGLQSGLMRFLFRITVQALDGVQNTQENADGAIPKLLGDAGFCPVEEIEQFNSVTGTIAIYRAGK